MRYGERLQQRSRDVWDGESYGLSKRLWVVNAGECYGIFQSVFHTAHFVDHRAYRMLVEIGDGIRFSELESLRSRFDYPESDFYTLILYGIENHILVSDELEEKRYIEMIRASRDPTPTCHTLYLFPTLDCNLTCSYCFIKKGKHARTDLKMSRELAQRAVDFLADTSGGSPKSIIFYGGEPLLHFDLIRHVTAYVRRWGHTSRFGFSPPRILVVTNGMLLDQEMAECFEFHDVQVAVSLDGQADAHETVRKSRDHSSSFAGALNAIRHLEEAGTIHNLSLTLTRENIGSTPSFIRWIANNLECRKVGLNFLQFCGTNRSHFAGPPGDAALLDEIYDALDASDIYEETLSKMKTRIEGGEPALVHCDAQGGQIVLLPDGTAVPCQALAGMESVGVPFRDGWNVLDSRVFRQWAERTPYNMPECYEACNLFSVCGGRCAYDALVAKSDLLGVDPVDCEVSKYVFERSLRSLTVAKYEAETDSGSLLSAESV